VVVVAVAFQEVKDVTFGQVVQFVKVALSILPSPLLLVVPDTTDSLHSTLRLPLRTAFVPSFSLATIFPEYGAWPDKQGDTPDPLVQTVVADAVPAPANAIVANAATAARPSIFTYFICLPFDFTL
jgi:hypothetical protein